MCFWVGKVCICWIWGDWGVVAGSCCCMNARNFYMVTCVMWFGGCYWSMHSYTPAYRQDIIWYSICSRKQHCWWFNYGYVDHLHYMSILYIMTWYWSSPAPSYYKHEHSTTHHSTTHLYTTLTLLYYHYPHHNHTHYQINKDQPIHLPLLLPPTTQTLTLLSTLYPHPRTHGPRNILHPVPTYLRLNQLGINSITRYISVSMRIHP